MSSKDGVQFDSFEVARAAFTLSKKLRFKCNFCGMNHVYDQEKDNPDYSKQVPRNLDRTRPLQKCFEDLAINVSSARVGVIGLPYPACHECKVLGREDLKVRTAQALEKLYYKKAEIFNTVRHLKINLDLSFLSVEKGLLDSYLQKNIREIIAQETAFNQLLADELRSIYEQGEELFSPGTPHESLLPLYHLIESDLFFINKTQPYNPFLKMKQTAKELSFYDNEGLFLSDCDLYSYSRFFNNAEAIVYKGDHTYVIDSSKIKLMVGSTHQERGQQKNFFNQCCGEYFLYRFNNNDYNDVQLIDKASFPSKQDIMSLINYFEL